MAIQEWQRQHLTNVLSANNVCSLRTIIGFLARLVFTTEMATTAANHVPKESSVRNAATPTPNQT